MSKQSRAMKYLRKLDEKSLSLFQRALKVYRRADKAHAVSCKLADDILKGKDNTPPADDIEQIAVEIEEER